MVSGLRELDLDSLFARGLLEDVEQVELQFSSRFLSRGLPARSRAHSRRLTSQLYKVTTSKLAIYG